MLRLLHKGSQQMLAAAARSVAATERLSTACAQELGTASSLRRASILSGTPRSQPGQQPLQKVCLATLSANDGPRYLVTGAGGQVGAELVPYLRERVGWHNVFASDVRCASEPSDDDLIFCDVTDKDSLARVILDHGITAVVHLASLLSATGERNPQLALRVNCLGIQNVLELAAAHRLQVFAPSTIAVFGASTPRQLVPDETVCEPSTMYGITKVHAELLGQYYATKLGVDYRSLRYPGIISSHTLPGGGTTDYAVAMYLAALQRGTAYECFLDHDVPLPMMYMPDCLRATWELMTAPRARLTRTTYNLTAMTFTPRELERSIASQVPGFQVAYKPDFRHAIAQTWPASIDDSLATRDWGWMPHFNLSAMTSDMLHQLAHKAISTQAPHAAAIGVRKPFQIQEALAVATA